jgi:biotin carboxyl carrier protein
MTASSPAAPLSELLDFASTAGLTELVWEKGDRRVSFKRAAVPAPATPAPKATVPVKPEGPRVHKVLSPMVGTFLRGGKDRPPLVLEGMEVSPGQRLGVVEAMQIPKDVVSDVAGRIVKILVENGKPVEYGQPIFDIEMGNG